MTRLRQLRSPFGDRRGFTLVELLIVVAIIGILAAIAIPLYKNMQQRARVAKAQADVRAMASAYSMYAAHMGSIPAAADSGAITLSSSNTAGQTSGAFLAAIPAAPQDWSAYVYSPDTATGMFTISAAGDGTTARVP